MEMQMDVIQLAVDADGIATLTIDYPGKSMNVIDQAYVAADPDNWRLPSGSAEAPDIL
jgi:hypothetical protein